MGCTTDELRERDVINVCNGQRLGCVSELEIDVSCGRVTALIVAPDTLVSAVMKRGRTRVPWDRIQRIGCDTILVDLPPAPPDKCDECESDLTPKKEKKWWHIC